MTDYPLLPVPAPARREIKGKGSPLGGAIQFPSRERQGERLGPVFQRLRDALDPENPLTFADDPAGIAPERALVFEIAGSVGNFHRAVSRVDGLELLGDEDTEAQADEDFFVLDQRKGREGQVREDQPVSGRMYVAMPDLRALEELLSLWDRYQAGDSAPTNFAPLWHVFGQLRELRAWGPEDRVPEDTIESIGQRLADAPDAPHRMEIELWSHAGRGRREAAWRSFDDVLREAGGDRIDHSSIPEVAYEAALVDLPADGLERLLNREGVVARCDDVMVVRPQSSVSFVAATDAVPMRHSVPPRAGALGPPVAAVLDGVPVQRHALLDGRLQIDDPDELETRSDVGRRRHGTAMASLIVHGDRNRGELPLERLVHVRPVLVPTDNGSRGASWNEEFPRDQLLIDTIYRAVKRIKEGDEEGEATAPSVFLVNLSLGDKKRPFAGPISPWARLLDHLAARYGILFLVSAGNVADPLPVPAYGTMTELEKATPASRRRATLEALGNQRPSRTLLSPAEAMNVLTVGAWHEDSVTEALPNYLLSPLGDGAGPNVTSAMGLGYRKVVKPEIMMPGGREPARVVPAGNEPTLQPVKESRLFGLGVAVPDSDGNLDREGRTGGTSAAAALATRAACRLFEALLNEDNGGVLADVDSAYYGVVVKALLVHRARWGEAGEDLLELYESKKQGSHAERKDNVARLIGYGRPDVEEALACASNRATLVGHGNISANRVALDYSIPLPRSLEQVTELRSVTCTLAWFSPVNVRHRMYRRAKLDLAGGAHLKKTDGFVQRAKQQPSHHSVRRGSLLHVRYEGRKAATFVEDGRLRFTVSCSAPAGELDDSIRFGLAVTIETGERIPVYEEVREQLTVRPRARLGT